MPPRKSQKSNARRPQSSGRRNSPGSRPGAVSWLLLWPFLLLNLATARLKWPLKWALRLAGHPALVGAMVLAVLAVVYGLRAKTYDLALIHAMPERSVIIDRMGQEVGRIHGEKRSIVPLAEVSENFRKAIIAREDERFYRHGAIDLIGIARAVIKNLQGKREGASTITQQLASDIFQLKRGEERGQFLRQLNRKFLEIAIAWRIETTFEKDEILETYINQINWGRQIKGVGEASRIYFEKHPAELDLPEAALLAGIVRGPDAYNPFRSIEAAQRERNTTLERMVDAEMITRAEADAAKKAPVAVRPVSRRGSNESYAMNAIRRDLEIIL
ncbi:MAG TPA: biosynthetic peptidoglycan transglycosylase, partial [Luteolibacter sp.]|nr:biosynthetic peptidoglycan transglycosylase [Luteolibacter sp.]